MLSKASSIHNRITTVGRLTNTPPIRCHKYHFENRSKPELNSGQNTERRHKSKANICTIHNSRKNGNIPECIPNNNTLDTDIRRKT